MKLIEQLRMTNSQKNRQIESAMTQISQHLHAACDKADWSWSDPSDSGSYTRIYTEAGKKQLIGQFQDEYVELVTSEKNGGLNNLENISIYFADECSKIISRYDIGNNIFRNLLKEEKKDTSNKDNKDDNAQISDKKHDPGDDKHSEIEKNQSRLAFRQTSFFKDTAKMVSTHTPLPMDITNLVAEYATGILLEKTIKISNALKEEFEIKLREINKSDTNNYLNSIMNVFFGIMEPFIGFYLSTDNIELIIFGLPYNNDSIENHPLKDFSPSEKRSFIEVCRAVYFLGKFNFHRYAEMYWPDMYKLQIKIYSLKAHLEKIELNEETKVLFNILFEAIMPAFPENIKGDELGNFDISSSIGSFWYDKYIYDISEETIKATLTSGNYRIILDALLISTSDPIVQLAIIESVWSLNRSLQYSDDNFVSNFFKLLASYAKKNIDAASAWIVTSAQHGFFLVSDETITEPFTQFSTKDLFSFIQKSTNLFVSSSGSYVATFLEALVAHIFKNINDDVSFILDNFKNDNDHFNMQLIMIQLTLLTQIKKYRPDLLHLFNPIKLDIKNAMQTILADTHNNPMLRNSDIPSQVLTQLSNFDTHEASKKNLRM